MGRRLLVSLLALSGAHGCGDDNPSGPRTVQVEGRVVSSRSGAGIVGAEVSIGGFLSTDPVTTTTGSDGSFAASVEVFDCAGIIIFAAHEGYVQPTPFPDVCPTTSRTIPLDPEAVSSVISPQDPTVGVGGTIGFQVQVTYADGTVDNQGEAVWFIAAENPGNVSACGAIADAGTVRTTTYTAPPTPPPADCDGAPGQVAVGAAPVATQAGGSLDASDTVVVTVTP